MLWCCSCSRPLRFYYWDYQALHTDSYKHREAACGCQLLTEKDVKLSSKLEEARISQCQREFVQIAVCIKWVDFSQVAEFLQGFVDKDEANEGSEGLLCEPSDVAHQRACVRGNQEQTQQGRPQADAGPQWQIGQAVVPDVGEQAQKMGNQ